MHFAVTVRAYAVSVRTFSTYCTEYRWRGLQLYCEPKLLKCEPTAVLTPNCTASVACGLVQCGVLTGKAPLLISV